jgi:hypothetical protein
MSKKTDSLIFGYLLVGAILVYVIKNYWKAILGFIALGLAVVAVQKLYLLIEKKTRCRSGFATPTILSLKI